MPLLQLLLLVANKKSTEKRISDRERSCIVVSSIGCDIKDTEELRLRHCYGKIGRKVLYSRACVDAFARESS